MIDSQRGAWRRVGYYHLMSNTRSWNNCFIKNARNRRDFENDLTKKFNAKRFLKNICKKVNDVSALRYAIIKLKS